MNISVLQCISDILSRGSIPDGYVCADEVSLALSPTLSVALTDSHGCPSNHQNKNTLSTYQTSFNTVLEQFVGIVPPSTMTEIQTRTSLLPFLPLLSMS